VQRQREHDLALLVPTLSGLTERQAELFFVMGTFLSSYRPEGFERLVDLDVTDAAAALASTLETSLKGVIYEHRASSLPAQRLVADLGAFLTEVRQRAGSAFDRDAAAALRRLERGAREAAGAPGREDRAYLDLLGRLMRQGAAGATGRPPAPSPIITGT
jgi:hypothetical protein